MLFRYLFFHMDEMDRVLNELKKAEIIPRSSHRKFEHTEILGESDDVLIGMYSDVGFAVLRKDVDIEVDALKVFSVRIEKSDETFRDFKFGKVKIRDENTIVIEIDPDSLNSLVYDILPALEIELIRVETFLKECNLRAESLSVEETKVIKETTNLSHNISKIEDVVELEKALVRISGLNMDFYRRFMSFKDLNENLFSAIMKFEILSMSTDLYREKIDEFKDSFEMLRYFESKFEQTLSGIRDLYSMVSIKLDTLRNRENLELQKRTSSLQAAAVVIEFVAVFYYTMKIWENFSDFEKVPPLLSFTLLTLFSFLAVAITDGLGEYIREGKMTVRFRLILVSLAVVLIVMAGVPNIF